MTSAERSRQPHVVPRMVPPAAGAVGVRRCAAQDTDTATGTFCEHARSAPSALPLLVVQGQHTLGEGRCELPAHKVRCALPVQVGALRTVAGAASHTPCSHCSLAHTRNLYLPLLRLLLASPAWEHKLSPGRGLQDKHNSRTALTRLALPPSRTAPRSE